MVSNQTKISFVNTRRVNTQNSYLLHNLNGVYKTIMKHNNQMKYVLLHNK